MKKILVPTDFSSSASKALDYAVCLAKKFKAEIILLHASEFIDYPFKDNQGFIEEHNQRLQQEMNRKLQNLKSVIEVTEGITVTTRLYDGPALSAILFAIRDNAVDLVIMGTLGKSGIGSRIFGSKTASLLSQTDIPVIAIPNDYTWSEPKKILLALNDPNEDPKLLKAAFEIANQFRADMQTVIFTDNKENAIETMEHSRSLYDIQVKINKEYKFKKISSVHISGENFKEAIQRYINENDIDLLAMITHKRSMMQRLFKKSSTKKMAYHTRVPLLSINAGN